MNSFSKEERVAFEDVLEGFNDALVLSKAVKVYNTNATQMERSSNTIWRPMPYIVPSYDGTDQTGNFNDKTQLSVPSQINISKSVPLQLTANELNDQLQENRLGDAAKLRLASDVNVSLMNTAANQGTLVVKRTTSASGFDDVAQCDALMNEQGVQMDSRCLALSSRDYNNMSSNLASRSDLQAPKALTAYEKAYIGNVSGFDTLKLDYANQISAAAATTVTIDGGNQNYVPAATSTATTGETSNVDNRYQDIVVDVDTGTIAVGDCFTIAGVNAVNHITKNSTGELKTFRVIDLLASGGASGTIRISPPIISAEGGTQAEIQYQNVDATPADNAAIVFLNTAAAAINPFWRKEAIELLPGKYAVPANAGVEVLRASTDQGMEVVMQKFYDINNMTTKYRFDTFYGTVLTAPEQAGIMLFDQV